MESKCFIYKEVSSVGGDGFNFHVRICSAETVCFNFQVRPFTKLIEAYHSINFFPLIGSFSFFLSESHFKLTSYTIRLVFGTIYNELLTIMLIAYTLGTKKLSTGANEALKETSKRKYGLTHTKGRS